MDINSSQSGESNERKAFLGEHHDRAPMPASPLMSSPAEHIDAFKGDPDFMTSLARGVAVMQAFQERKRRLTIAQISYRTGISRASVRRCLHTLMCLGYVTSEGRKYALCPKVLTLGHAYISSTPLPVAAQPLLDGLSEQLHAACSIGTLESDEVLYIARSAVPKRLISVDLSVGSRLPAYCTSMGRILLAALDDIALAEYLQRAELTARTRRTLCSPETLLPCINEVREKGWCIVNQEFEPGLRALAVPVTDRGGQVLSALNVCTPISRVSQSELENRFLPLLIECSKKLRDVLFH